MSELRPGSTCEMPAFCYHAQGDFFPCLSAESELAPGAARSVNLHLYLGVKTDGLIAEIVHLCRCDSLVPPSCVYPKNLKRFTLLWECLLCLINFVVTLPSGKYPTCLEVPRSSISKKRWLQQKVAAVLKSGAHSTKRRCCCYR